MIMSKYICGYCARVHTEGTQTILRHAKKDIPNTGPMRWLIERTEGIRLKKPFKAWMFYWLFWPEA
jgi:hypothetical protein